MRVVAATALVSKAMTGLLNQSAVGFGTIVVVQTGAGLLLFLGLWTPLAGLLVVLLESGLLFSRPEDPWPHILLATLGGALALLGPGAWSADARLFGWKRIDIRDRQTHADTDPER